MQLRNSIVVRLLLLLPVAFSLVGHTAAQQYPAKLVKVLVTTGAGGNSDIQARILAQKLGDSWAQPVIVENVTGAGGNIAAERVAKSAPDGYTILFSGVGPLYFHKALYRQMNYDIERDFDPVTQVSRTANIFVVHSSLPVKSLKEFIAYAKANPGTLRYGSGGNGTSMHVCNELFKHLTGTDAAHIPYKSVAQMGIDLVGGQFEFSIHSASQVLPHIRTGKLRPLAVTTQERFFALPEVPTMAEAGVPGIVFDGGNGLLVPRGTPPPVIDKINRDVVKGLQTPAVRELFAANALEPVGTSPAEFRAHIKTEIARWTPVIRASGASLD